MTKLFNNDQRFLVTGASSGIGLATSIRLLQMGAHVIASARNIDRLNDLKQFKSSKNKLSIVPLELSDANVELDKWVLSLARKFGKLTGAALIAGKQHISATRSITEDSVNELLNVNFKANLTLAKGFCDKRSNIGKGSSLVFMSSISSVVGEPGLAVYSATKGALNSLTRSLAKEYAERGIRVNAILPGLVKTELLKKSANIYTPQFLKEAEEAYPLGLGNPEDIAGPVTFLLGHDSNWITGQCIVVDGGKSI